MTVFDELRRLGSGWLVRTALRLWPAKRDTDAPVIKAFECLGAAIEIEARAQLASKED